MEEKFSVRSVHLSAITAITIITNKTELIFDAAFSNLSAEGDFFAFRSIPKITGTTVMKKTPVIVLTIGRGLVFSDPRKE